MSSIYTIDDQDFIGRRRPAATGPGTGIGDVISAAHPRYDQAYSITAMQRSYHKVLQPIVKKVSELTGQKIANPADALTFKEDVGDRSQAALMAPILALKAPELLPELPWSARESGQSSFEEQLNELNKIIRENNLDLPTHSEKSLIALITPGATEAERKFIDVTSRAGLFSQIAGEMIGGFPTFVSDAASIPGGVFTLAAGAKYKALSSGVTLSLLRVGLIDAALASSFEAALQPGIWAWREKMKLKHDLGDALMAVAGAGAGTGALRMLGSGAFVGGKAGRERWRQAHPGRVVGREMLRTVKKADAEQIARNFLSLGERDLAAGIRAYEQAGVKIPSDVRGAAQSVENATETPYVNDNAGLHDQNLDLATRALAEDSRLEVAPGEVKPVELDNLDETVFRVDPQKVEVDAKLFQFRSVVDEFGVGERLQNITKWDDAQSGIVVVYEFNDGRQFIVDGHQRLGLAKRIMANDPSQKITLYARKWREADGMTPQDAMIKASLLNIANTVEGSPQMIIDAAKILRIAPDELRGVLPPRAPFVRAANNIAVLSDDAFMMVINDVVPVNQAAIIGRLVDDPEKHAAIMQILSETSPSNLTQAEAIIRQARELEFRVETQDTLFGEEFLLESLFKERAKVLDKAIATLRKDRAVFNTLVKNEERIEASGNQLSTSTNQQRATTDGQALQVIQTTANREGALSDALTAAAEVYRDGGNLAAASREFADAVRRAIESGDLDGMGAGAAGRIIDDIDTRVAARATAESLDAFDEPAGKGVEAQAALLQEEIWGGPNLLEREGILAEGAAVARAEAGEILPDSRLYLLPTEDSIDIPTKQIMPIRRRPEGVANARVLMAKAALGAPKRGPLSVKQEPDGTYTLLDGNSTYAIAEEAGMPTLPARVLTDEEFAAEVAQKNAQKIVELGPDAKKTRLVLAEDLSEAQLENLASVLKVKQAYDSIDDIMRRNEAFNAELNDAVKRAAGEHEIDYHAGPLKERDRVEAKISEKYFGNLNKIADASRATVAVSRPEEAAEFIKSLSKIYHVVDEGYQGKARGSDAYSGYFDKKLMVINKDGVIGEVIVIERNLHDAKEHLGGHLLYEISRGDADVRGIVASLPDPEMRARLEPLLDNPDELARAASREQRALYEAAHQEMGSEFSEMLSSVLGSMPATTSRVSNSDLVSSGVRVSASSSRADISPQTPLDSSQINAVPSSRKTEGQLPSNEKNLIDDISQESAPITRSEATAQGEQTLIPGVEPITGATRAQQAVDAPLEGGAQPMDIGLFDEGARAQMDMLDLEVPTGRYTPDGDPETVSGRQLLDEIEQDQSMLDRLEGCV